MIRLTELQRTAQMAVVKVEGYLTEATLQVLVQTLADYQQQGLQQVQLRADGLRSIDRLALEKAQALFPAELRVSFHTSRLVIQKLLESCGVTVVFH